MIVPTRNRSALLATTLRSVFRRKDVAFKVIVVDEASTDDTAAVLAAFGEARLRVIRHDEPRWLAAARNHGAAEPPETTRRALLRSTEYPRAAIRRQRVILRDVDRMKMHDVGRPCQNGGRPRALEMAQEEPLPPPACLTQAGWLKHKAPGGHVPGLACPTRLRDTLHHYVPSRIGDRAEVREGVPVPMAERGRFL